MIQKGPLLAASTSGGDPAAAESRGAPAAAAAATAVGDSEMTVMFLSMMVAGNCGLAGKGQVSRLKVICTAMNKDRHTAGLTNGSEVVYGNHFHTAHTKVLCV